MGFFGFPSSPRPWEFSTNQLRGEFASMLIDWQRRLLVLGDVRLQDGDAQDCVHLMRVARIAGIAVIQ